MSINGVQSDGVNAGSANETRSTNDIDADVAVLASVLSTSQESSDDLSDADVSRLLRQLETANGLASGVESRLNNILDSLDDLLGSLETEADTQVADSLAATVQPEEHTGDASTKTEDGQDNQP